MHALAIFYRMPNRIDDDLQRGLKMVAHALSYAPPREHLDVSSEQWLRWYHGEERFYLVAAGGCCDNAVVLHCTCNKCYGCKEHGVRHCGEHAEPNEEWRYE